MKTLATAIAILVLGLCPCPGQTVRDLPLKTLPGVGAGPALIITVDSHDGVVFANLPGIKKDREAMKATLLKLGFEEKEITVVVNPSAEEMRAAMKRFGEQTRASSKASFFYFSGHGVLLDGKNYLIPAKAPIQVQGHLATYAVPVEHVLAYLGGEKSGPALVFVDACRNNTLPRTEKSSSGPIRFENTPGIFIGYATGEGRVSRASKQGSVFTTSLCQRLLTPGYSVDDIYAGVVDDVQRETATEIMPQDPQKQSAMRVIFHLVPGPSKEELIEKEVQRRMQEEREKQRQKDLALSVPSTPQPGAAAPAPTLPGEAQPNPALTLGTSLPGGAVALDNKALQAAFSPPPQSARPPGVEKPATTRPASPKPNRAPAESPFERAIRESQR